MPSTPQQVIDAIWRMESGKIIAVLTRMVRDVELAEELAQDALVAALEKWPTAGVPDNAAAWLMQMAKHKAIDRLRHGSMAEAKHDQVEHETAIAGTERAGVDDEVEAKLDDNVGDDLLK